MSTTIEVQPLTADELAAIELPNAEVFPRTYTKPQPKYASGAVKDAEGNAVTGRVFQASGPKADLVAKYIFHGGYTRQEIATFVNCSVSRVGEVLWAIEAAGLEHPELVRRRDAVQPAKPVEAATVVEESSNDEDDENEDAENEEDENEDA